MKKDLSALASVQSSLRTAAAARLKIEIVSNDDVVHAHERVFDSTV